MKLALAVFLVAAALCAGGAATAAELPLRHANPAPTAKRCVIDGHEGMVLPGSDTCMRLSGYVSMRTTFGRAAASRTVGPP